MCLIFTASTDLGSPAHSSRIIGPLLRWLNPDVTPATIDIVQAIFRKGGHAAGYAILALLLWRALRLINPPTTAWSPKIAKLAVLIAFIYASTDEFHQIFVPSRGASIWDVLLDTTGAALGIWALWMIGRARRKW